MTMETVEKTFMTSGPVGLFQISEALVAERLGVSLDDVKKLRSRHREGLDWCRGPNRRILWSVSGIESAYSLVTAEKNPPRANVLDATATFQVVRARTERVLHIVVPGQSYDHRAPVCMWLPQPKAHLFRPGMKVLGRKRAGRDDLWDYEGNPDEPEKGRRFPRKIGVW